MATPLQQAPDRDWPIQVRTASRLHFGLLSLPGEGGEMPPARRFGGVGLMVRDPGVCLSARPAAEWSGEGPLAGRALAFARACAATLPPGAALPLAMDVTWAAPEHQGLGTGTQLGLAVARAVCTAAGRAGDSVLELARRVGRGRRSGLGVHGFAVGGLLVDAGKRSPEAVAPLVARLDFPEDWPVVLVLAPGLGLHGRAESQAFEQLARMSPNSQATDRLCRLVLLGLLPPVVERDSRAFGEALFEFNVRVGEMFAPVQGGIYAHPAVAEVVSFVRGLGIAGVGQSSWGPAVYAVAPDADVAADVAARLRRRFEPAANVLVTRACNCGSDSLGARSVRDGLAAPVADAPGSDPEG
jgi:beta-RFAP synthase